ncbi:hypothetical protein [Roseofilum casamattae]|uniref:Tetratricopeptide repeat protein n=1 Tax=Roseofilum casamattae BLCC-M143 TaxID=3022442 RepID=A0ABT7C190_9CYAN|nr:hypothetical protein [Roseofilum casamattae]MDJ1185200.1 hypothetical protein [Roseofilum casamattae BLCC-M143]
MEPLELVQQAYQTGRIAFERGKYREAIAALEQARAQMEQTSQPPVPVSLKGQVQIWLVTAYEAAGKREEALSLCETLEKHPDYDTRKQARRLLEILRAPQLMRSSDWNTKIPDFATMDESDRTYRQGSGVTQTKVSKTTEKTSVPPAGDQDNSFVWVALIAVGLAIAGFIWWG